MTAINYEEYELLADGKYRAYVAVVDKILKNFENTSEWADLISTLNKLNKVLMSYTKYPVVPRRITISKRLAQCLHPALPSGVHLKAIETYDIIFKCMGTNRLSQELFIYSAGLFPLFGNAAMNVRSALLVIYETHFVPLGARLRPGLSGFMSGILSGMDDGSDHLDRTSQLLIRIADGVGQTEFFGCIWECIRGNASVRLSGISHILSQFNKKLCTEDQLFILGSDIDVMISAMCHSLEDGNVMVQRAALDLVLAALPMHNTQLLHLDLVQILGSAVLVVLRRDMSLNRRLFAWLLGTEVKLSSLPSEHPVLKRMNDRKDSVTADDGSNGSCVNVYFDTFSRLLLVEALVNILRVSQATGDLRPYRLMLSLLDRPEIGPNILDLVFLNILRCFYHACHSYPSTQKEHLTRQTSSLERHSSVGSIGVGQLGLGRSHVEITKTAGLLFSALEPAYPWRFMLKLMQDTCISASAKHNTAGEINCSNREEEMEVVAQVGSLSFSFLELCALFQFLLSSMSLDTHVQAQSSKLPQALAMLTAMLREYSQVLTSNDLNTGLGLCHFVLARLTPSSVSFQAKGASHSRSESHASVSTFSSFAFPQPVPQLAVAEVRAHDSPPSDTECGIIQIGIEAEELCLNAVSTIDDFDSGFSTGAQESDNVKHGNEMLNGHADSQVMDEVFGSKMGAKQIDILAPPNFSIWDRPMPVDIVNSEDVAVALKHPVKSVNTEMEFENVAQLPPYTLADEKVSPLYSYVREFESLFFELVVGKILSPHANLEDFSIAIHHPYDVLDNSENELRDKLNECIHCSSNDVKHRPSQQPKTVPKLNGNSLIKFNGTAALSLESLRLACKILVDLSSLPITPDSPPVLPNPNSHLPDWLVALLTCVICGAQVSPELSLASISTLVELVALARSELSVWSQVGSSDWSEGGGTVAVHILPLLMPSHIHILLHHTTVFQNITKQMWEYLDPATSKFHLTSVELLVQLHSLTSPPGCSMTSTCAPPQQPLSLVERELLIALTSPAISEHAQKKKVVWTHDGINNEYDTVAMRRWMTLWQVSRYVSSSLSANCLTLHRCLFLMIERLKGDGSKERCLAHTWLANTLQHSDIARVFDPILVCLLQPHTRRVSIQHVSVEKIASGDMMSSGLTDQSGESQIYAISSVGGEVMYHVSKGKSASKNNLSGRRFNKHVLALTTIGKDRSSVFTENAAFSDFAVPSSHEHPPSPNSTMFMLVNPFSQHPWIDFEEMHSRVTDVDKATRVQGGSYQKVSETPTTEIASFSESAWTSSELVRKFIDDLIESVLDNAISLLDDMSTSSSEDGISRQEWTVHPLHSHLLLYTQIVDSGQCMSGLRLIRNVLESQPKLSLLSLASTSVTTLQSTSPLVVLLARHRKSVFGEGFDRGNVPDMIGHFRSTMYLQVVITVCLYYLRSYYPRLPHLRLREEHLRDNWEVLIAAAEVLGHFFTNLTTMVTDSPRGFVAYIHDLLSKCKVQKCVLHCLLSTVHAMSQSRELNIKSGNSRTFTEEILEYNCGGRRLEPTTESSIGHETYQTRVIDLILSLIRLEDTLNVNRGDVISRDPPQFGVQSSMTTVRYQPGHPITSQPMFLCVMVSALTQRRLLPYHASWLHLFVAALPHMKASLPRNSLRIVFILSNLLEQISRLYEPNAVIVPSPPEYTLTLLQAMASILHYCVLDASLTVAPTPSSSILQSPTSQSAGHLMYSLLHVFSPTGEVLDAPVDTGPDPLLTARRTLLSHLPRIVSSLLSLWTAAGSCEEPQLVVGSRRAVRQGIVELLSPMGRHHTPHLLAAVCVVWQGIGTKTSMENSLASNRSLISDNLCRVEIPRQVALVEMVAALRVLPLHSLMGVIRQVVKTPPIVDGVGQIFPLEVSLLQFFFVYIEQLPASQLAECWLPFLAMVRECTMVLTPPSQLVLLTILNEFVQRATQLTEKKDVKELQDVSSKLIESCMNIAGARLETTTWLRRNLTVKSSEEINATEDLKDASVYSVAALNVLSEILAPLLDVLYMSEEKEKVIPLLTNVMAYVTPYLRCHARANMPAFSACSQLLASLSGYQYTVRAWKRDVLDLLLDPQAFVMVPSALTYWRTVIDNLCAHDKTVFKELLGKVSLTQGGSLSLFSSKESEYEARAGILKRVTFTIFCSETDQYMKHIPHIQERLSEVTRLGQVVPSLLAQVLLCLRVLLVRMSPRGVTSLWPVLITELVQVFLLMEHQLASDTDLFSAHLKRLATLDSTWVANNPNGLNAHSHPSWLSLYLSACKLLDLMLSLPANLLPQFQMYRWAFVGPVPNISNTPESPTDNPGNLLLKNCDFVPHVVRIVKLMSLKEPENSSLTMDRLPGRLLLTIPKISTLMDLQPFFNTLVAPAEGVNSAVTHPGGYAHIEEELELDFLESLPN